MTKSCLIAYKQLVSLISASCFQRVFKGFSVFILTILISTEFIFTMTLILTQNSISFGKPSQSSKLKKPKNSNKTKKSKIAPENDSLDEMVQEPTEDEDEANKSASKENEKKSNKVQPAKADAQVTTGGVSFNSGDSDLKVRMDHCKEAKRDYTNYYEKVQKECGDYGIGTNCISKASICAEKKANGTSNSGTQMFSQLVSSVGTQLIGGNSAAAGTALSQKAQQLECDTTKSKEGAKNYYKDLYQTSKDSLDNAQREYSDIQKEAETINQAQDEAQKNYNVKVRDAKVEKNKIQKDIGDARAQAKQDAIDINTKLRQLVKQQIAALKEKTALQSELTQLYPSTMSLCDLGLDQEKTKNENEIETLKTQILEKLAATEDLRQKGVIQKQLTFDLQRRAAKMKINNQKYYSNCIVEAQKKYNAGYLELTTAIRTADSNLKDFKDAINQLNKDLADIPKNLASTLQSIQDNAGAESQLTLQELSGQQTSLAKTIALYNTRFKDAQTRLTQSQEKFAQDEAANKAINSVGEASLGNVIPLLSELKSQRDEMCQACEDATGKKPSQCGDRAIDDLLDGAGFDRGLGEL